MNAYQPPHQQPEPYGQPGPYGAPGPYSQPDPATTPGGYGAPAPYNQPGPYGAPQTPQGPPMYSYPPQSDAPYGYPTPPQKSKTPLIVALVVVVVFIFAVISVGTFLLLRGDDSQGGELAAPEGAPYSYRVPKDFDEASARAPEIGEFQTVYAPEDGTSSSVISVSVINLGSTDPREILQGVSANLERSGQRVTDSDITDISGISSVKITSTGPQFDNKAHYVPIDNGQVVYIYCEFAGSDTDEVEAGCERVIDTIEIEEAEGTRS